MDTCSRAGLSLSLDRVRISSVKMHRRMFLKKLTILMIGNWLLYELKESLKQTLYGQFLSSSKDYQKAVSRSELNHIITIIVLFCVISLLSLLYLRESITTT